MTNMYMPSQRFLFATIFVLMAAIVSVAWYLYFANQSPVFAQIADTTTPSVPQNLTAAAISSSQINLSWTASTDDVEVAGYKVYRNGSLLSTVNSPQLSYSDTGLQSNTTYTYTVSAYDMAGNESGLSTSASATTLTSADSVYYVSPIGSNSNPGTYNQPWQTITYATGKMIGGDTLILKDGTYKGTANKISPPSGSAGNYTIIKAENDQKAVIDGNGEFSTWDYPITLYQKSYIQIEGLKITGGSITAAVFIQSSDHIKVLRTSIWNGVQPQGQEANPLQIRGSSSYVLIEDVWITGVMRYGIIIYKDSAINPGPQKIIIRRAVVRWDYSCSNWPKAGIAAYGNVNGEPLSEAPKDILIQNSIVLDLNPASAYENMWGGFFNTGETQNIQWIGNIALNIKGLSVPTTGVPWYTPFAGFIPNENRLVNGGNNSVINSVAWDITGAGLSLQGSGGDTAKTTTINQFTAGNIGKDAYADLGYSMGEGRGVANIGAVTQVTTQNSLFYNNKNPNPGTGPGPGGSYIEKYSSYWPASLLTSGATNYLTSDSLIKYITRVETNSPNYGSGELSTNRGATIIYRYGVDGTLWGESGYDQLTTLPLWPWPNEDQIKVDFSQANDPNPALVCNAQTATGKLYPTTNNTLRGFTGYASPFGTKSSLTSYIWEYLGNACPLDICNYGAQVDTTPPSAPTGLVIQ